MNQQSAPYVLAPGQARSHPGTFPTIKAGAADTGGLFTFCDGVMPARTQGPALHVHYETDEFFYVTDGHLLVQVGQERHDLGPGSFAWLPRQVPHAYANVSASPVHMVGAPCRAGSRSSSPRSPPTSPSCRDPRTRSRSRPSGPATPAARSAPPSNWTPRPFRASPNLRPATQPYPGTAHRSPRADHQAARESGSLTHLTNRRNPSPLPGLVPVITTTFRNSRLSLKA